MTLERSLEQRCIAHARAAVPEFDSDGTLTARRLSGGISNHLFVVEVPNGSGVLVRLYGAGEPLAHRPSEEAMVQALSARGFGPHVLAVFEGGRVEQYWAARRPLLPSEALQQAPVDFATLTAARLAELHELQLAVPGRATAEEQLTRWLGSVEADGSVDLEALSVAIASAPALRPTASTEEEAAVADVLLQRTLCHLDLFAANLLYDGTLGDVQFIDYEYASDAPVGLDIANYLSGCTELIEGDRVSFDTSLFPTAAQQAHLLRAYLAARGLPNWSAEAMAFATRLLVALAAEAELRWVVWGLLQAQLATVSFEYGDYASQRWGCYRTYVAWASQ